VKFNLKSGPLTFGSYGHFKVCFFACGAIISLAFPHNSGLLFMSKPKERAG